MYFRRTITKTSYLDTFSVQSCSAVKCNYGALLWRTDINALALQFMIIEKTGKKALLLRGYSGMSAVLILLTITLYFQVSCNTVPTSADAPEPRFSSLNHVCFRRNTSGGCPTAAWSWFSSSFSALPAVQVHLPVQSMLTDALSDL